MSSTPSSPSRGRLVFARNDGTQDDLPSLLADAVAIAQRGGDLIRTAFASSSRREEFKTSAADVVTETDRAVEDLIKGHFHDKYPHIGFVGEETGGVIDHDLYWVVDPVDGTTNFVAGFPYVAVSIGLVHHGVPILGVVHNPILNETFTAHLGGGAHLNGARLPLSDRPLDIHNFDTALLATEYGYERDEKLDKKLDAIGKVVRFPIRGLRSLGSAAIEACYVARGALDAYWEAGVHTWDIAAATIIVRESGGVAVNYFPADGSDFEASKARNEKLDLQCRQFLFVRSLPDEDACDRVVRKIRAELVPIPYQRD